MDPAVPVNPLTVPDPFRYYRIRFNGPCVPSSTGPNTQTLDGELIGVGGPAIKWIKFYDVRGRLKTPIAVISQDSGSSVSYNGSVPAGIRSALGPVSGQLWQMAGRFDRVVYDFGVPVDIARIEVTQTDDLPSYSASDLSLKSDMNAVILRCDTSNSPTFNEVTKNFVRRWSCGGSVLYNTSPYDFDVLFANGKGSYPSANSFVSKDFPSRNSGGIATKVRNFYVKRSFYIILHKARQFTEIEAVGLDASLPESLAALSAVAEHGTAGGLLYGDGDILTNYASSSYVNNRATYFGFTGNALLDASNMAFGIMAERLTSITLHKNDVSATAGDHIVVLKMLPKSNAYTIVFQQEGLNWDAGYQSKTFAIPA